MRRFLLYLLAFLSVVSLNACAPAIPENETFSVSGLTGKMTGTLLGSPAESYLENKIPGAVAASYTDSEIMLKDLLSGRLDCIATDAGTALKLMSASKRITRLDEPFIDEKYSIMTAKENPGLTKDINSVISALEASGALSSLIKASYAGHPSCGSEYLVKEGAATLYVAIDPTFFPYCYYDSERNLCGLETEVAKAVCSRLGLNIEFKEMSAEKFLSAVQNGRAAFAIGRIIAAEDVIADFTATYLNSEQVILVRK